MVFSLLTLEVEKRKCEQYRIAFGPNHNWGCIVLFKYIKKVHAFFLVFVFALSFVNIANAQSGLANMVNGQKGKVSTDFSKPIDGSIFLNVVPSVELFELTVAGVQDPKAEWSGKAKTNIETAIKNYFNTNNLKYEVASDYSKFSSDGIQHIKLHEAVVTSIAMNNNLILKLPTKTEFDWKLGGGASVLAANFANTEGQRPDYALFVEVQGSYSSGARKAMIVGAALLGGGMPSGVQIMRGSILDLKSGDVFWYQEQVLGFATDPREQTGAVAAVDKLFKKLPIKAK